MSELKYVSTSHAELACRDSAGSGLPLLLIHGNSTCHQVFRHQIDGVIGASHRCIAFDLPGHGDSADAIDPDRSYNVQGYADAAIELMRTLGIDRYAVLGWSLGGHIALDMMAQATPPASVLAGVMITGAPPIGQHKGAMQEGFTGDIEHSIASKQILSEEDIALFAHNTCGPNAPYDAFLEQAVRRCDGRARSLMIAKLACGVGPNQQTLALNAPAPLAIVNGADDAFINNNFINALPYQRLWENQVHDLPGVGHAPFWEQPERFNAWLQRFLSSLTP